MPALRALVSPRPSSHGTMFILSGARLDFYGCPKGVRAEKMLNDLVGVNFATFATYFDGLLSMDEKARRIYQQAAIVLESIANGVVRQLASLFTVVVVVFDTIIFVTHAVIARTAVLLAVS